MTPQHRVDHHHHHGGGLPLPSDMDENTRQTHLDTLLRRLMASMCRHAGFRHLSKMALEVMIDLYVDVLISLGSAVQKHAEHTGRAQANLFDLGHLFHLSSQIDLFSGANVDAIAFAPQSMSVPASSIHARAGGLDLDLTSLVTWLETHLTHHYLHTMDGQNYHHRRATVQLFQRKPKIKRLAFIEPNRPELGVKPPTAQLSIPPQVNKLRTTIQWLHLPPECHHAFPIPMQRARPPSTLTHTTTSGEERDDEWVYQGSGENVPNKRIKFAKVEEQSLPSIMTTTTLPKRSQEINPFLSSATKKVDHLTPHVTFLPSTPTRLSTDRVQHAYIQSAAMLVKALEETTSSGRSVKLPWDFPIDALHFPNPTSFSTSYSLYASTLSRQQSRWTSWVDAGAKRIPYYPSDPVAAQSLAHLAEHVILPIPSPVVDVPPLDLSIKLRDAAAAAAATTPMSTSPLFDAPSVVVHSGPAESSTFKLKLGKSEPAKPEQRPPLKLTLGKMKAEGSNTASPTVVSPHSSLAAQIFSDHEMQGEAVDQPMSPHSPPPAPPSATKSSFKLSLKQNNKKDGHEGERVIEEKKPAAVSGPEQKPRTTLKLNAKPSALTKTDDMSALSPSSQTADATSRPGGGGGFKLKLNLKAPTQQ